MKTQEEDNKTEGLGIAGDMQSTETPPRPEESSESKEDKPPSEETGASEEATIYNDAATDPSPNDNGSSTEEELEQLKAEKVVGMIDPIYKNGKERCRLLYLTNRQASTISNRKKSIKTMIGSFCRDYDQPKLIINLVQSWGFYNSTKLQHEKLMDQDWSKGIIHNTPPFRKDDEYKDLNSTMAKLTHFVSEVILPLAERTNAIILCNAIADDCVLTESLIKVLRMKSSRWDGNPLPFTIIKFLNQVHFLYNKETIEENGKTKYLKDFDKEKTNFVEWTDFKDQSKNWKLRHSSIEEHFRKQKENCAKEKWWRGHDLDWSQGNLIVVEALDPSKDDRFKFTKNHAPAGLLLTAILDTYSHIPTLAIKTGATPRVRGDFNPNAIDIMNLAYLVDRVCSDTHVILLDVRKREKGGEEDPFKDFDGVKLDEKMESHLFPKQPDCESLDCCALSYFGSKMPGKGKEAKEEKELAQEKVKMMSLKERMNQYNNKSAAQEKDSDYYIECSRQFVGAFRKQLKRDKDEDQEACFEDLYCPDVTSNIQTLLMSDKFHCKNIWEGEKELEEYIETNIIFKFFPRDVPPLEGLKLLEKAWEYVDKTKADADGYRVLCNSLVLCQIFLGLLITVFTAATTSDTVSESSEGILKNVTLITSLLLTAVVAVESLLTPKLMWRQLRIASVELESLIWKYRAGVGAFKPGLDTSRDPENNFDKEFTDWKEHLHTVLNNVGGTMVPQTIPSPSSSALPSCFTWLVDEEWTSEKKPLEKKEGAGAGVGVDECCLFDDHHSYVLSDKYLEFRLERLIKMYQDQVPKKVWIQQKWQLAIIGFGAVIAFFSETPYEWRPEVILILTAIVAALKSWSGFVDTEGNLQLYPRAINAMRNKKMEWEKRTKHQQQDREVFEDLVMTTEGIATNVVESWSKSLSEKKYDIPNFKKDGDTNGENSRAVTNDLAFDSSV